MPFEVSEERIREAEQQLGCRFPKPLFERLLRSNGGSIEVDSQEWELFPVWDPTDRKRMARTANHVVKETAEARKWRGFPEDGVAVAADGSGDLLVLETSGRVLYWNHETGIVSETDVDWRQGGAQGAPNGR